MWGRMTGESDYAGRAALRCGAVRPVETVREGGISTAFNAFLGMLQGADLGKTVVRLD